MHQRKKRQSNLTILSILFLVGAFGQSTSIAQDDAEKKTVERINPISASPLSAYQSGAPLGSTGNLNGAILAARGHLPAPASWDGRHELKTESVDLSSVISSYAKIKNVSAMDARLEALAYLGMSPKKRIDRSPTDGPTFEIGGVDLFRITAHSVFFKTLPYMLDSLEMGKVEIEIQVKIIEIDSRLTNRVNRYLMPGSEQVICSRLPIVTPSSTDSFDIDAEPFVTTTTVVRQNMPVTMGTLTRANRKKLEAMLNSDPKCEIVNSPVVRLYAGQVGSFSDTSLQPFVVGLSGSSNDKGTSTAQPIVQPVENGTTVRLRAIPKDTGIQLFADVAISEILEVKKLTFASGELKSTQSIQIPKQKVQQMHLSAILKEGQSILVDPNFIHTSEKKGRLGKKSTRKTKTLLLFQVSTKDPT